MLKIINYNIISEIISNDNILGLHKVELFGSKIVDLIGRTTARDVYDVFQMIKKK